MPKYQVTLQWSREGTAIVHAASEEGARKFIQGHPSYAQSNARDLLGTEDVVEVTRCDCDDEGEDDTILRYLQHGACDNPEGA